MTTSKDILKKAKKLSNFCHSKLITDDVEEIESLVLELIELNKKEAQKEVIEEIINEYLKESERSHFGLKLLKFREALN